MNNCALSDRILKLASNIPSEKYRTINIDLLQKNRPKWITSIPSLVTEDHQRNLSGSEAFQYLETICNLSVSYDHKTNDGFRNTSHLSEISGNHFIEAYNEINDDDLINSQSDSQHTHNNTEKNKTRSSNHVNTNRHINRNLLSRAETSNDLHEEHIKEPNDKIDAYKRAIWFSNVTGQQ